jgi:hypothetical protein
MPSEGAKPRSRATVPETHHNMHVQGWSNAPSLLSSAHWLLWWIINRLCDRMYSSDTDVDAYSSPTYSKERLTIRCPTSYYSVQDLRIPTYNGLGNVSIQPIVLPL